MKIEFLKYTPTPTAKFLGIAEIIIEGKLVLRYKVTPGKEGKGLYFLPASIGVDDQGTTNYTPAFEFDSNILKREIDDTIRKNFNAYQAKPAQQASVFSLNVRENRTNQESEEQVPF